MQIFSFPIQEFLHFCSYGYITDFDKYYEDLNENVLYVQKCTISTGRICTSKGLGSYVTAILQVACDFLLQTCLQQQAPQRQIMSNSKIENFFLPLLRDDRLQYTQSFRKGSETCSLTWNLQPYMYCNGGKRAGSWVVLGWTWEVGFGGELRIFPCKYGARSTARNTNRNGCLCWLKNQYKMIMC